MQDLIEALKREVDLHKSNFYKMERNYRNVQESNRTLSCKCKELEEEKNDLEQKYENAVDEWRLDLEKKTREFDEILKSKIQPMDSEVLRVKFLAEAERSSIERFQSISDEINKWKTISMDSKRELELYKAKVIERDSDYKATIEDLGLQYRELMIRYENSNKEKSDAVDQNLLTEERLRQTLAREVESSCKIRALLQENQELSTLKADLVVKQELISRNLHKQNSDLLLSLKSLESEKDSLRSKIKNMEEEIRNSMRREGDLTQANNDLSRKVFQLQDTLQHQIHQSKVKESEMDLTFMKEKTALDNQIMDLKKTIEHLKAIQEESQTINRELKQKQLDLEKTNFDTLQKLKIEESNKLQIVESCKHDLEKKLQEMTRNSVQDKALNEKLVGESSRHIENLKTQLSGEEMRGRNLVCQIESLKDELFQKNSEINRMQEENHKISKKISEFQMEKINWEKLDDSAKIRIKELESEIHNLQYEVKNNIEITEFEKKKFKRLLNEHSLAFESQNNVKIREIEILKSEAAESAKQIIILNEEIKKTKLFYKKKMEESKKEMDNYAKQMREREAEIKRVSLKLDKENKENGQKLLDMYKKQEMFLDFLKKEGLSDNK